METSTRIRIWKIGKPYVGKRKTTYKVRWTVAGKVHTEPCSTRTLADAFRSKLLVAARDGIAFEVASGLPVTAARQAQAVEPRSWFDVACEYVDTAWEDSAPRQRKTTADTLTPITLALTLTGRGRPSDQVLRAAMRTAFNTRSRAAAKSVEIVKALDWLGRNTRMVHELADPEVFRRMLVQAEKKRDGTRASANTVRLRRSTLSSVLNHAVERKLLENNPIKEVTTKKRRTVTQVDRRSVANPVQFRTVLREVPRIGRTGGKLVAFFGLLYFAGLRPEEALHLRRENLDLPPRTWDQERGRWVATEWGSIHLSRAAPEVGGAWTDSGLPHEERGLKHRADEDGRTVPLSSELALLLHEHLATFATEPGEFLFVAERGGRIGSSTYCRVWELARTAAFTPSVAASPIAKRPYDLRHACVSMWLNAGVEPPRVAEWAGHSVAVLMRVYAKCMDGGELAARARVQAALNMV
ncbi:tyrosine-type recombinase/integrase [Actinosynnema pretiosum]|uniref:Integrase n=1 Tax=Actinosynnema pretiosum TaxID=42197 RepID=A0A290ZEV2_9PSEU|nr:tyrosine-type recombinase/integrase [Actinosynnema pretiosum]ATE57499.1 integrase [Actinosynnema pretiosum]